MLRDREERLESPNQAKVKGNEIAGVLHDTGISQVDLQKGQYSFKWNLPVHRSGGQKTSEINSKALN